MRPFKASTPCKSRSFSVFGLETLIVAKFTSAPRCDITLAKSAARSSLSLLAPRLTPKTPSGRFCSRRARAASMPLLLNPKRLIAASSSVRRKRRGLGFPGCARGVIAPISTKPKPARIKGEIASPFLSKPAATPIGFESIRPARSVDNFGSSFDDLGPNPKFNALSASRCEVSGSILRSALSAMLSPSCRITAIPSAKSDLRSPRCLRSCPW